MDIFYKKVGTLKYTLKRLIEEVQLKKAFEIANTAGMSKAGLEAQFKRHNFVSPSQLASKSLVYLLQPYQPIFFY